MPDPIDYTSAFAGLQSPTESFVQGLKVGDGFQQLQAQQRAAEAAVQQKAQMQTDLAALAQNPTTAAIAQMSIKYPQLSEGFKRSYDMLTPEQQQAKLEHATQVYAALNNGEPKIAQKILTDQAAALRNSGNEPDAKAAETMASWIDAHPESAKSTAGLMIAKVMGPKFTEAFKDIGGEQRAQDQAPSELRKKVAEAGTAESTATTKAVEAKYADQQAVADLAKKGWDVKAIIEDIGYKKESNRIAAMKAAIDRQSNDLKRQELQLKINDAVTARDDKVRGKVAEAESAAGSIDNMLNNITRILAVASDKEGKPTSVLRASAGPLDSRLPTVQGDVADMEALVESLGAQAFLAQIPNIKGMGSLSNAEGEKLQSAFQNFSLKQSPEQIIYNLMDAKRLLEKGRGTVSKRFGVPLGNPDTPAAAGARPPLSSFEKG